MHRPTTAHRPAGAGAPEAGDFQTYAAVDLGTNNCRLLVARARGSGFRVIDAYSRIVRLGEGLAASGVLSEAAMDRTVAALKICADKMRKRGTPYDRQFRPKPLREAIAAAFAGARTRA